MKVPGIIAGACRTRGNLGPGLMIMVTMEVMVVEVVLMVMIVVEGGYRSQWKLRPCLQPSHDHDDDEDDDDDDDDL